MIVSITGTMLLGGLLGLLIVVAVVLGCGVVWLARDIETLRFERDTYVRCPEMMRRRLDPNANDVVLDSDQV